MKLAARLLLSFGAITLVALVIGTVGYYGAVKNQAAMHEVGRVRLTSVDSLLYSKAYVERIRALVERVARSDITPEARKHERETLLQLREKYSVALKAYEDLPKSSDEATLVRQLDAAIQAWRVENEKLFDLARSFEEVGIVDPKALALTIEQMFNDHHDLSENVLLSLRSKEHSFKGGEDHLTCRAGKWLQGFRTTNEALRKEVAGIEEPHRQFHAAVARIKQLVAAGKPGEAGEAYDKEMSPALEHVFEHFEGMRGILAEAIKRDDRMTQEVDGPARETFQAAIAVLDRLVQVNRDLAARTVQESNEQGAFFKGFTLVAMIGGSVAAVGLGLLVTRLITRQIQRVTSQLATGAEQANAAANQVAAASHELANGATEQAAAVEETSSALEELSSMTQRNAESSAKANGLASQARTAAEKGTADMKEMSAAMNAIKTSSDDVANIIKTIDEIAFQTNILALNAAVEAARAGEAGMGFAVVADEVRTLAQRSAQAARDTAEKIESALGNTARGVELSTKVADSLAEIAAKTRDVNQLVSEVATASHEQSQGISQINTAITQMDKVVQANAAGAEQTSAASEELKTQALLVQQSATRSVGRSVSRSVGPSSPVLPLHAARESTNGRRQKS